MQVQVNTDDKVEGSEALSRQVTEAVEAVLSRFRDRLTRVEIHLSDENAGKSGSDDKRCVIEARPVGQQPVGVTHQAATLEQAYSGALRKLKSMLESNFGQMNERKGAESIRDSGP